MVKAPLFSRYLESEAHHRRRTRQQMGLPALQVEQCIAHCLQWTMYSSTLGSTLRRGAAPNNKSNYGQSIFLGSDYWLVKSLPINAICIGVLYVRWAEDASSRISALSQGTSAHASASGTGMSRWRTAHET
jgi:hypothetical protein